MIRCGWLFLFSKGHATLTPPSSNCSRPCAPSCDGATWHSYCAAYSPIWPRRLRATGLDIRIGIPRIFREQPNNGSAIRLAIELAYYLIGDAFCANCPRRQGPLGTQPLEFEI